MADPCASGSCPNSRKGEHQDHIELSQVNIRQRDHPPDSQSQPEPHEPTENSHTDKQDVRQDEADLRPKHNETLHKTPRKRLTALHIAILIVGPVVSFGTLGFLAFLWIESYRARNSYSVQQSWYNVLDSGWVLRAITVATFALRTAISFEAGLATSMIAALLIERRGVRLSHLADVSILRATDSPPHVLAWTARIDMLTPPLHASRYLLVGLVVTTLIAQLSSTILLFDFADATVPRVSTAAGATIPVAFSQQHGPTKLVRTNQAAYFQSVAQFPRFAEISKPPIEPDVGQERDFRDTGEVYRAFLPLRKEDRQLLRRYSGPATVLDSRVVCARPTVSNLTVSSPQVFGSSLLLANLTFHFDMPGRLRPIKMFSDKYIEAAKTPFTISVPVVKDTSLSDEDQPQGQDKQWSMFLANPKFPLGNYIGSPDNSALLLFNWTASYFDWLEPDLASPDSWTHQNRDEWVTFHHRTRSVSLDLTLCFNRFNDTPYLVETEISGPATEPGVLWDRVSKALTTSDAVRHLGVPSQGRRGIPSMTTLPPSRVPESNTTYKFDDVRSSMTGQVGLAMEAMQMKARSLDRGEIIFARTEWAAMLANGKDLEGFFGIHISFTTIFQEIIQQTENPAIAIQSLLTMAIANAYVELQQYFDYTLPAQYSIWAQAFIPTRWVGFILVTAAVVVHTLAVMAATVMFTRETRCTQLGNAWQAVAQLVSGETQPLLSGAVRGGGDDFKARLREDEADVQCRIADGDPPQLARTSD